MSDKSHICLLGRIIVSLLLTGMNEAEVTRVFISSGENVSLSCNNALHDCTSTTWNYNNYKDPPVELFAGGIKKNDIERHERLSLGSNCSLNIYKTTEEDHGVYNCRQYVNGQEQGTDARVSLHVLHVSSSSTQTEMRSGSSVSLSCQLFTYENSCDILVSEGFQLVWVNQAGVDLHTDSRYQILSQEHCNSTLTTKLLNEDNNTEWRCLLKKKKEIKTSASYTVRFMADTINTSSEDLSETSTGVIVISAVIAALAVVLPAAVLWVICKKRADNREETYSSVDPDKNTYDTIHISSLPTPSNNEQTNDVTYCEVTASRKQQIIKNNVHCDEKVTYATIKGAITR